MATVKNLKGELSFDEYVVDIVDELNKRFELQPKEINEIIFWYKDDIEEGFFGGKGYVNAKTLVNSLVVNDKLKWKS